MDAACNDFTEENLLDSISSKSKAAISKCQMFLKPKPNSDICNTDIVIWINEFHKSLDDDYEAGIEIQHLGNKIVFYLDHIAHQNQSMIYFKGYTEKGKLVHFVKHLSELNIQLQKLKSRRSTEVVKKPFGFNDWDTYSKVKQLNG